MRLRALVALTGVVLAVLTPSAARAADEIGFSNDGVSWSTSLPAPLFDPAFRWVPGDSESASFYVRNQGPTSALMTIELGSADTDELLANDDIDLRARVAGGSWIELDNGVARTPLTNGSIARGGVVQIEVNATFDAASTNQSQIKRLPLSFTVTLADAKADVDPGGSDHGGLLPTTGLEIALDVLMLAVASTLLGGALLARRSTSSRENTDV